MNPIDEVGVTFVNAVLGRGTLNGVMNVQLGVLPFDIGEDGNVSPDIVVACRLRMDMTCAKQLRDCLDDLLSKIDKATAIPVGVATNGDARHPEESLN